MAWARAGSPSPWRKNGDQGLVEPDQGDESKRQQENGFQHLDAEGVPQAVISPAP
jgi:hypothetical protein